MAFHSLVTLLLSTLQCDLLKTVYQGQDCCTNPSASFTSECASFDALTYPKVDYGHLYSANRHVQMVDVRGAREIAEAMPSGMLPNAINVPRMTENSTHTKLAMRTVQDFSADFWSKVSPHLYTVIMCRSGGRAMNTLKLLREHFTAPVFVMEGSGMALLGPNQRPIANHEVAATDVAHFVRYWSDALLVDVRFECEFQNMCTGNHTKRNYPHTLADIPDLSVQVVNVPFLSESTGEENTAFDAQLAAALPADRPSKTVVTCRSGGRALGAYPKVKEVFAQKYGTDDQLYVFTSGGYLALYNTLTVVKQ